MEIIKENKKKYKIIIGLVVIIVIAIIAILAKMNHDRKYIEEEINVYVNDGEIILENISGCISKTDKCNELMLTLCEIHCNADKSIDLMNIDGYCNNGNEHRSQTSCEGDTIKYCKVYTDRSKKLDVSESTGVKLDTVIQIFQQMDFEKLDTKKDKEYDYIISLDEHFTGVSTNDFYVFENNKLEKIDRNQELDYDFQCINVTRMYKGEGSSFMTIVVKTDKFK